jgi:translation initiation factor IF-2
MAAAKEFNIGKDTLVDFLVAKGFDKDELKPTAKLSEDMYRALQAEFQSDKVAKMKSTQIDLPKGATADAKKKKDEEEISFHKGEKKAVKKEEPAPAPAPAPVAEVAPPAEPVQEVPQPQPQPVKEEEVPVKLEAPEI